MNLSYGYFGIGFDDVADISFDLQKKIRFSGHKQIKSIYVMNTLEMVLMMRMRYLHQ